jgi:hypothetical protein
MRFRFWQLYRRLFGARDVRVFCAGEEDAMFSDEDVVWAHAGRRYLTVVCLWDWDREYPSLVTYRFPYAQMRYWTKEFPT